ncbi:MAG: CRISPR-associated protein Cas5 [Thermostichus sp. DRC_bins_24]
MSHPSWLSVKVWGDFACFTRPEFGAERVSYEVMTPSAARGILEAIFWKPEFVWQLQETRVCLAAAGNMGTPANSPLFNFAQRDHHLAERPICSGME